MSIQVPISETPPTSSLIEQSLASGVALNDSDPQNWDRVVDEILSKQGSIIALRGAGSVNGSDPESIDALIGNELAPRIEQLLAAGMPVTILYDGDPDSPERPDIGYVAGRLLDRFGNNINRVVFVAVQKQSWYYPPQPGANLANANGAQFATYVFQDKVYTGDHNSFTQDPRLVAAQGYEQWYVGASGIIATEQLSDYASKVPQGTVRPATLFRMRNNPRLDAIIQQSLDQAREAGDLAKVEKLEKQLAQRTNIYGAHWDNNGMPMIDATAFSGLDIRLVY